MISNLYVYDGTSVKRKTKHHGAYAAARFANCLILS
jgi:hypothetical protein